MLTTEALIERGAQAEFAKPYLNSVVVDAREGLIDRIMDLSPDQTALFSAYKAQIQVLDDIMLVVEADIIKAKTALEQVQNHAHGQKAGIL